MSKPRKTKPKATSASVGPRVTPNALALNLFDELFPAPSWDTWKACVSAILGLPVTDAQAEVIKECTGRSRSPTAMAREVWLIVGRRAGKSQVAALLAVYLACFKRYRKSHGEKLIGMLLAADRKQAQILKGYIAGLLRALPQLEALIARELSESIELTNGITIECHTSSFKSTRGYTCIFIISDEVAFWFAEDGSANPAAEVLRALRPSLTTTGGPLICLTTPFAREGPTFETYQRHFGKDDDPIFVWNAGTLRMNPTVSAAIVEAAYAADPESAAAEYGGLFRSDLASLFSVEALAAVVATGRRELRPVPGVAFQAFVDPSGGSQDSMCLGIAHRDTASGLVILDCLREIPAPFSPAAAVAELAKTLKAYGCRVVVGDRYAGQWPADLFATHGIAYHFADKNRSEIYIEALPLITSGRVELLDSARLLAQLGGLQRRAGRTRDAVDHRPGAHDDLANSACGALLLAQASSGLLVLPEAFKICNREASGLPGLAGTCYLFGGVGRPPADICCRNCSGNQFVRAARTAHEQRTGASIDIIEFFLSYVQIPEAWAWRALAQKMADHLGLS